MASLIEQYLAFFDGSPFMYTLAAVALLVVLSAILNFIVMEVCTPFNGAKLPI